MPWLPVLLYTIAGLCHKLCNLFLLMLSKKKKKGCNLLIHFLVIGEAFCNEMLFWMTYTLVIYALASSRVMAIDKSIAMFILIWLYSHSCISYDLKICNQWFWLNIRVFEKLHFLILNYSYITLCTLNFLNARFTL